MATSRQRKHPHRPGEGTDLIAPERHAHVTHFRPVFPAKPIIDAEFEDIASEPAEKSGPAPRRPGASGSRSAGRPRARAFSLALAGLCAASFWFFGGHAVFARLVGKTAPPLVISGISTRVATVDGLRVAIIDGEVTNTTSGRQRVPAIGVSSADEPGAVAARPSASVLQAGESTGFRAHLPVIEGETPAVDVTFIDDGH